MGITHLKLEGKSAIVTNVDRELGREIALALAREGANIMVSGNQAEILEETVVLIEGLGRCALAAVTDLSDESQVSGMVHTAIESFGKVDILVNNSIKQSADLSEAVSLSESFLCAKTVIPQMLEKGSGKIVNVGWDSRDASDATGNHRVDAYWGVLDFSETLAEELGPHNIQVTAIPLKVSQNPPEDLEGTFDPQQVAAVVVFHCSSESGGATSNPHEISAGYAV